MEDIDTKIPSEFYRLKEDSYRTETSKEQIKVENSIAEIYDLYEQAKDSLNPKLLRNEHVSYLLNGIKSLGGGFQSLDASRPWLCYWILHALELLGAFIPDESNPLIERTVSFLSKCQSPNGGFGGGPNQLPHLAPTYASVNALMICGTESAYKMINREKLYHFLLSLKDPVTGHFTMHKDGEVDMRASYCALTVASLLNILTPELANGAAEFIARCQTYEGGLGGYPGNEAHGGYTFCGFAALTILGRTDAVNVPLLLDWAVRRQMNFEGGFQGRTNKLVDSCYSWWQGGLFPLLDRKINKTSSSTSDNKNDVVDEDEGSWLFVQTNLQKYLLMCCQDKEGGMKDKPRKHRDFYHTCYALSGLSMSQHNRDGSVTVLGEKENLLEPTHHIYNIGLDKVDKAFAYFRTLPLPN